jgi:energy-coupling factor transport system permease protein
MWITGRSRGRPADGREYADSVAAASRIPTRVLLICAAVGVATGVVSAGWAVLHGVVAVFAIAFYGLILGFHSLPGVIAQEVLRRPWVALITHAIAALVASAIVPTMAPRYLLVALLFGGVQEGISALTRYRHWEPWRFFVAAAVTGVLLAIPMWFAFDLGRLDAWAQVTFLALFVAGPVAWTAVGLAVGVGLRRAGVVRSLPQR